MAKQILTVLAGTGTGLTKQITFPSYASRDRQNNLIPKAADEIKTQIVGGGQQANADTAVQHMTYIHKENNIFQPKTDKLAIARKNRTIDIYRFITNELPQDQQENGRGRGEEEEASVNGISWQHEECLEGFDSAFIHLSSHDKHLIAATASGTIFDIPVFDHDDDDDDESEMQSWQMDVPSSISALQFAPGSRHVFATVGRDLPLTLWDLNKTKPASNAEDGDKNKKEAAAEEEDNEEDPVLIPTFQAKGPPNDKLDLRIEQHLTGVQFLDDSGHLLITMSEIGHIAVYDTRVKKRPIALHQVSSKASIVTSAVLNPQQLIFADAAGSLQLYDVIAGRCLGKYKGSPGVTHAVHVTADKQWVVSTGVDRFVRVHDATSRELIHSHYIKSKGSQILLDDFSMMAIVEEAKAMEDAAWDEMEVLASGTEGENLDSEDDKESNEREEKKANNKRRKTKA